MKATGNINLLWKMCQLFVVSCMSIKCYHTIWHYIVFCVSQLSRFFITKLCPSLGQTMPQLVRCYFGPEREGNRFLYSVGTHLQYHSTATANTTVWINDIFTREPKTVFSTRKVAECTVPTEPAPWFSTETQAYLCGVNGLSSVLELFSKDFIYCWVRNLERMSTDS